VSDSASAETLDRRLLRGAIELDEVVEITRLLAVHLDAEHAASRTDGALVPARIELRPQHGAKLLPASDEHRGVRAYTAPECWNEPVTASADQFAMAAILYEALCGGRAFPGDDSAKIRVSITTGNRVPLAARVPGLAEAVDAVFEKALSLNPSDRYASCSVFAEALIALIEGSRKAEAPVLVQKPSARPVSPRPLMRRYDDDEDQPPPPIPWLKIMGAMILLAILAGMMAYFGR
jgi:serine/threonine protein kinase